MTRQDMESFAWKNMLESMSLSNRIKNFEEASEFLGSERFKKNVKGIIRNLVLVSQEGYESETGEKPEEDKAYSKRQDGSFETMTRFQVTGIVLAAATGILLPGGNNNR